jgi:CRISPR-associated protein Cas1
MIKKTLYFGNPAYLRLEEAQLRIEPGRNADNPTFNELTGLAIRRLEGIIRVPIEDIGIMVLDNPQITLTEALIRVLILQNILVIHCNDSHLPFGFTMGFQANLTHTETLKWQVEASLPLKKQLWKQTIQTKLVNQASVLKTLGFPYEPIVHWSEQVLSGDSGNMEARAAAYYWKTLFSESPDFRRHRAGIEPNNLLNYSYAILRAVVARALVSSGLYPSLGIFHRNKYNPFCLADDIMEPFRPMADLLVYRLWETLDQWEGELTPDLKKELLRIPAMDVSLDEFSGPLMVAMSRTTASLVRCYEGSLRKVSYPVL